MRPEAYQISHPETRDTGTVFASPHSGRDYPESFISQSPLSRRVLRSSEDAFVDLLFGTAPSYGAPLLSACAPRAYVDLNRAIEELDPSLIEGVKKGILNPRVASGLGVIPRVVAKNRLIHPGRISQAEAESRLIHIWHPYHRALQGLLSESRAEFGAALLIDCHSMPREALLAQHDSFRPLPQIVLGDRHGASCGAAVMAQVQAAFTDAGFVVARNTPFAGAYITQAYGRPSLGQHAVQIEIDRSLYMDEEKLLPHEGFEPLRQRLSGVIQRLAQIGRGLRASTLAAE